VRDCHLCRVQHGFPAIARHSVTLGRAWWWAQSNQPVLFTITKTIVGRALRPELSSPERGGRRGHVERVWFIFFAMNLALARTVERGTGLSGCTGSFCPCSVSSHAVSSSGEAQTERPSRLTGIPDFCQRCATDTVWPEEFHDLSPALQGSILRLWLRFRHNQPEVRYQFSAQSAMRRRHRYRTSHPGIR
jgi:hypothetical protein